MKKICFLVGSMGISGGTYVILQHASYLRRHGYDVTLAVQYPIESWMLAWHDETKKLKIINFPEAKLIVYDIVIATWWQTAMQIQNFKSSHYGYFVQSIESRFISRNSKPALYDYINSTYHLKLPMITEASWISKHLKQFYNQNVVIVRNGIRKDIYTAKLANFENKPSANRVKILIEGPFGVSFKNTSYAIKLAKLANAESISVLTSTPVKKLPYVDHVYSKINMIDTPEIYRSCDVLLKLSTVEGMFGPPLEMFHCGGTAIVFNVTGHDEYIIDKYNARVAELGNSEQVIDIIKELKNNPDELKRLKQNALLTAHNWPDWNYSSHQFLNWIEDVFSKPPQNINEINEMNQEFKELFKQSMHTNKKQFFLTLGMNSRFRNILYGIYLRIKRYIPYQPYFEVLLGGRVCR
ncbi:MAG: glycosyltransferase [Candidatus Symbiobacter sp.]|nr:glycosyltransferase [Candidatus Symbiobacter sp.]